MKVWIPMLILFLSVTALCVWDSIYSEKVFDHMQIESEEIYVQTLTTPITDENLSTRIENLNNYWTEKMDILCISIYRKDLQVISDYLQYLCSSITNNSQEDAITYSRLLKYNVVGLNQSTGAHFINLL